MTRKSTAYNYCDIIVDIIHVDLDKPFQYKIPLALRGQVKEGMCVNVPFGKGNRIVQGYVIRLSDTPQYDPDKTKGLLGIAEGSVTIEGELIRLAVWMKNEYGGTMIQALKVVLPVKQKIRHIQKKEVALLLDVVTAKTKLDMFQHRHYTAKARLLQCLIEEKVISWEQVTKKLGITAKTVESMRADGILEVLTESVFRSAFSKQPQEEYNIKLNFQQSQIADDISNSLKAGEPIPQLIHGITGSGKTEIYMEVMEKVIMHKRQVILLIPEISLTYQTVRRFYQKFGDRISIMHSRLSAGERFDQLEKARRGEIDIIIGPRSALFTPFERLGLIVIDEEHEASYKSETTPKYHSVGVAIKRAKMLGAGVVLGSATPSIESYQKAVLGEYKLHTLSHRNTGKLADIYLADLRQELKNGNRSIFSKILREKITNRLNRQEQVMLFMNRRGYARFVSCRSCGFVIKCSHCDVSYTLHHHDRMVCHYCGREIMKPVICPMCSSKYIARFGLGTQQLEEIVKKEFPQARVLRMDMDTTGKKNSHEKILSAFASGQANVLIGTQMIVKGHDFPNVTLVGIMAADMSLYTNDYRASERTFQLLVQASGRAGRGQLAGEVVIQTYNPEHYCVQHAKQQDYEGFFREEISYRGMLGYPPTVNMMVIFLTGPKEQKLNQAVIVLSKICHSRFDVIEGLELIGPSEATIGWINDIYRRVIYYKHKDKEMLKHIKDELEKEIEGSQYFKEIVVQFDINPLMSY